MWSLWPISETIPVLNLSVRNSNEPILNVSWHSNSQTSTATTTQQPHLAHLTLALHFIPVPVARHSDSDLDFDAIETRYTPHLNDPQIELDLSLYSLNNQNKTCL